ncbi:UNVERIFIED_CONTAM: hypothetical protein HDU68_005811 [Siphonaria sp. JEL0065]|nr:hypothetical protein HDU68_005811 [Siphonaria sp. JEL0065]
MPRKYLAITSLPTTSASSDTQTNLILLAEWILIAKHLNRTLILPTIEKYRTADKSYQTITLAPLVSRLRSTSQNEFINDSEIPLEDWFQVYSNELYTGKLNRFDDTILSLHEKSDSIINPLSEFINVIGFQQWVLRLQSRGRELQMMDNKNQSANSNTHPVSIAFVNNADEGVECSSDHDDIEWPEWTNGRIALGVGSTSTTNSNAQQPQHPLNPSFLPDIKLKRITSDVCIFSPEVVDSDLEGLTSQPADDSNKPHNEAGDIEDSEDEDDSPADDTERKESPSANRKQFRAVEAYQTSISAVANSLVGDPAIRDADIIVVQKQVGTTVPRYLADN